MRQEIEDYSVETVENAKGLDALTYVHRQLVEMRERFIEKFGIHPSVMYVGEQIYERGFPSAHSFPVKCWAIEDTLVRMK